MFRSIVWLVAAGLLAMGLVSSAVADRPTDPQGNHGAWYSTNPQTGELNDEPLTFGECIAQYSANPDGEIASLIRQAFGDARNASELRTANMWCSENPPPGQRDE